MADTPKIRFKGFTEDWERRKLGEVCKINGRIGFRGYTEKDIISKEEGGILTYSPTNIVDNNLVINCRNTYITKEKFNESPEIMISNGDILFVKTGSTLGKSALVTGLDEEASINPQIVVIRTKKGIEAFLSIILITQGILKQVVAAKIGGAVPTLTETEIKNFEFFEPNLYEEKIKIGEWFKHLDHLITLHQRKCDEVKELKKYMLQKMFPKKDKKIPEIRFAGFTDDWEERKLGEIAGKIYGGGTPKTSIQEYWNGNIPWIQSSNLSEDELFNVDIQKYITQLGLQKSVTQLVPKNSIAVVSHVGVGKLVFIPFDYTTSQDFISLSEMSSNPVFMCYVIYKRLQEDLHIVQGSAIKGITKDDLLNKSVWIPSLSEQEQIGNYFRNLDHLISLHQRKCDELKEVKKFMLQNMFPQKG
ncbi:MAG: restriction endonuclease subunit S [Firmicutes bacterium]|nr:restriction endonuclease subunit S [Bacillota bacterium]